MTLGKTNWEEYEKSTKYEEIIAQLNANKNIDNNIESMDCTASTGFGCEIVPVEELKRGQKREQGSGLRIGRKKVENRECCFLQNPWDPHMFQYSKKYEIHRLLMGRSYQK